MKTIQFNEQGEISNFTDLFKGIRFSEEDNGAYFSRAVTAWLPKHDQIPVGTLVTRFVWGEVKVKESYSKTPYTALDMEFPALSDNRPKRYGYRIHVTENTTIASVWPRAAAAMVDDGE